MKTMGRYCKAYTLDMLRQFDGWSEKPPNVGGEQDAGGGNKEAGGGNEATAAGELNDDSIVYVQENYVVTDGIYLDEGIIFDAVTPEWMSFCKDTLKFEIPDYITEETAEQAAEQTAEGTAEEIGEETAEQTAAAAEAGQGSSEQPPA